MPYPDKLLAEDEEIVRHLHPHWLTIFWPVVWFLLLVGAASFGAALIPVGQQQGLLRLLVVALGRDPGRWPSWSCRCCAGARPTT